MKPVTIIGGGLSGLTLGIGLRQRGAPVEIREAGGYPRHRVCGEFISGSGQAVLARLGLLSLIEAAGPFRARTVLFVCGANRSAVRDLPHSALCLSRYKLDALLAEKFRECGGQLHENRRWTWTEPREGLVRAAGRRPKAVDGGWRWFGAKGHVSRLGGAGLQADLEMHVSSGGYVGVNRIDHGDINVCGLFRARPTKAAPATGAESRLRWLCGQPGSTLADRLKGATFNPESICSVAGLFLRPQRASHRDECCVGDAVTMTPPVTGNGMSMAFESAELAIEPLSAYSRGETNWPSAQAAVARACDRAFKSRLAWARWLQWLMFSPLLRSRAGSILLKSDFLWNLFFVRTR